jgi:hypothetical protein
MDKRILNKEKVLEYVRTIYRDTYGTNNLDLIEQVFNDVEDLFAGRMAGYMRCDTSYHDLVHTLQVIQPFIGIIDGINKSDHPLKLSKYYFDLGIIAVLLHDTGYIKTYTDTKGTGGKYTFAHIQRSIDFAERYLSSIGLAQEAVVGVRNIIMCTGVVIDYSALPFNSEEERILGYTLGTADLLGQMSDPDYYEKLPSLYNEFEESYRFEGIDDLREKGIKNFTSAEDLIRSTPRFYEAVVKDRFEKLGNLHMYMTYHFNDSKNPYIEAIEENIEKIRQTQASQ